MTEHCIDKTFEHIQQQRRKLHIVHAGVLVLLTVVVLWSVDVIIIKDTDWHRIGGVASIIQTVKKFFLFDVTVMSHVGKPMIETVLIACFGTLLGLVFALPVAWFGAYNITPSKTALYPFSRFLMTLSRSIHEMVWALIFVSAVGLGALPGILAIAMRSVGFISKIISEAIENIDHKPIEAIRAIGGNNFQTLIYGIVPQIQSQILGTIIFEWDINIRRSTIMGFVGAGGLGLTFFRQMAMYNYGGVTMVIAAILVLVFSGEIISHFSRKVLV